ncbi:RNA-binding S4 domain-containing protein [Granulicella tundricola]|uniref:RNA-binding S4 domain protein n=1 Tax=Granulicella tundricola (strain ATCC BAA-1859 / DSM 23138 / MP5ACTX9) TaxID=1198114 RepID=E8WV78_GRATM|nr:RNA-binding S4 domain-containing protein [Granulicella tundricola]ADW67253.1 RNA-binding S4 domain protein [Granulicella tundricola MP5ACTX9]
MATEELNAVRIDKWLWAARFFKTRALASDACEIGRIECNGQRAKASRVLHVGDKLKVKNEGGEYQIEVLLAAEARGSGAVAQTYYQESDESREMRQKLADERRELLKQGMLPEGKPTKQNRRQLDKLRGRIHRF